MERLRFIANVPAGIAEDENGKHVAAHLFLNQEADVIEINDSGYDTDRPTGYEPVMYLMEFDNGQRVWIPWSTYLGFDYDDNRDRFCRHLERIL